jgi:dTDP-glucose 4,6-dehydratase
MVFMQTLLVTGGAGFIGSNFAQYLLKKTKDYRVVILDKLTYAGSMLNLADVKSDSRFHFIKGDIADGRMVSRVFQEFKPVFVFNLAAETHVDRSIDGGRDFVRTNLAGTFELLEGARTFLAKNPGLKGKFRFLHISTDEVYGSLGKKNSFSEETNYAPNSPYAATKAGSDYLVRAYHETYKLPVLITNCSNNYGPYQFPEKLIPLTILNAVEGKPLPIYGDGGNVRDWLYVEDHCEALWLAARRGRLGQKYNVGGNCERTNLQIVQFICDCLERLLPPAKNPFLFKKGIKHYEALKTFVADRPGHDRRYAINATKIRSELGWKPRHDFKNGLEITVQWYLEHQTWCEKVQNGKYGRERLGLLKGKK